MTSLSATYYVSQRTGSDENDGRTCSTAFASLSAINRRSLQPGDRILLERGSVFYGQYLHVTDSGTKEATNLIGAYGTAAAPPRIDANGQRTVYQGAQKAGVRIRQKVEVTGSGKVQFFCNNKMVEEKNL